MVKTPNQGSAFGSGGPDPDSAEPGCRAAGTVLGLEFKGLARLGLKVCKLTFTKISGRIISTDECGNLSTKNNHNL